MRVEPITLRAANRVAASVAIGASGITWALGEPFIAGVQLLATAVWLLVGRAETRHANDGIDPGEAAS